MDQSSTTASGWRLRRRDLGRALAGTAVAVALPPALSGAPAAAAAPAAGGPAHHPRTTVRLGAVVATRTGGLLDRLVAGFEAASRYRVEVTAGNVAELLDLARAGELDLVAAHLGHPALRRFVRGRWGRWPQAVLATSFAFAASAPDPAGIREVADPVEAFARIARTRSPFVVNDLASPRYLVDTLWHAAGQPDKGEWFLDPGLRGPAAVREAARRGGYTVWGLHPLLGFLQQNPLDVAPVLSPDSLLQRIVATVATNPARVRGVNLPGALALERYLREPATQAEIRGLRHPAADQPIFWPAAHHNDTGG